MASLDAVKNFAKVTVSTGYDASATSIALTSGHGAKLPAPATDGAFNVVWWNSTDYSDPSDDPNVEIVRVTARSTDTLTVSRGQESTNATTKNTANKTYKMILGATAATITDISNRIQSSSMTFAADAQASDTYAITLTPTPTYTTGLVVNFSANTANTGAATLNVNSLGAKTIKKLHDQDLATGDIEAGQIVTVVYDGTNFQMQSQIGQVASSSVTATYRAGENLTANDACTLIEDIRQAFRSNQTTGVGGVSFGMDTTNAQQLAIKFIARGNYTVNGIPVYLSKTGLPADNVNVEIQTDSAGSPSGTAITNGTSQNLAGSSIYQEDAGNRGARAFKLHTMTFAVGPSLTSGTTYWLVFKRTGTLDSAAYYRADGYSLTTYADFSAKYYNGSTWAANSTLPYFRINPASGNRTLSAYKADADQIHLHRTDGFAQATTTAGNNVVLVQSGEMSGFTGLVPQRPYFLGTTAGAIVGQKQQYGGRIGIATGTTTLLVDLHHEVIMQWYNESNINNAHDYTLRFNINFPFSKIQIIGGSTSGATASISDAIITGASNSFAYNRHFYSDGTSAAGQGFQQNYMLFETSGTGGLVASGTLGDAEEFSVEFVITGSSGASNANISFFAIAEQ